MNKIPKSALKLFWGDNLNDLRWEKHKEYIAKTILEKGDKDSVKWLFERTSKEYLKKIVKEKKLDQKSKNFWRIYLS